MNYDDINSIIDQTINSPNLTKGDVIDLYEKLPSVDVVDSAIPVGWSDEIRKSLGVRNIGEWVWGYLENSGTIPLPCNERAMAYFEYFVNNGPDFIPLSPLMTQYTITYETSENEVLRTGVDAIGEVEAINKFAERKLGLIREIIKV